MADATTVDVSEVIERQKLSGFLVGLVTISWIITFFDGFDMNVIGYAAPYLSTAYHLDKAMMGYIFSIGLVGTLLVIGLFTVLAYAAIRVARQTSDSFVRYVTFGVVVWLVGQALINIGMVLAWLPVIGIPLPLVSYGGSALLPSLVALGLVIGFARREPEAAQALALRKRSRSAGLSAHR